MSENPYNYYTINQDSQTTTVEEKNHLSLINLKTNHKFPVDETVIENTDMKRKPRVLFQNVKSK